MQGPVKYNAPLLNLFFTTTYFKIKLLNNYIIEWLVIKIEID